jgi:hypothetical protein
MRRTATSPLVLLLVVVGTACSGHHDRTTVAPDSAGTDGEGSSDDAALTDAGAPDAARFDAGLGDVETPPTYPTIASLHEKGIARTCALNNGVCHNSQTYPDLHTVSTLLDTLGRPCNLAIDDKRNLKDPCEPPGDHLVIRSQMIDAEIATVDLLDANTVVVKLVTPVLTGSAATDVEVHRLQSGSSSTVFSLGAANVVATVTASKTVALDLSNAGDDAKSFLDARTYPRTESFVWEADPNHNGINGATLGWSMIKPGDPERSFLLGRLYNQALGELMPRQCRTWDDSATLALACWIEGLQIDGNGQPMNALDPIDYRGCRFVLPNHGKCEPQSGVGVQAIEAIASRSCAGGGCHTGPNPAVGLDLSPGNVRASLVGVVSAEVPSMKRVEAGNLAESYFWCKLLPSCDQRGPTARMPKGADALSQGDLDQISAWILGGAQN